MAALSSLRRPFWNSAWTLAAASGLHDGRRYGHGLGCAWQIGIVTGTNNALREIGGIFGIAVLATVFQPARHLQLA